MYDVIIVGGSIGGSSAAINASDNDIKVALIERNKKPFYPAHCGEAISDVTVKHIELEKIGCKKNEIKRTIIKTTNKEYVFNFKKRRMYTFDRNYFENKLLEEAERKNVDLFLGEKMVDFKPPYDIILDNNKKISGKVIIDASGIACQVGRRKGFESKLDKKDIGVCFQYKVKDEFCKDTIKFWFHEPFARFGYAWEFPLNDKEANIGLGVPGNCKINLEDKLNDLLKNQNISPSSIISSFKSCVPVGPPMEHLVDDNIMLVGDAARLVHSSSAAGIHNAIFSGILAGIISSKYVKNEIESLNIYEKLLKNKISWLLKDYKRKSKTLENEEIYLKKYDNTFSLLKKIYKIFPSLIEKSIAKQQNKDWEVVKNFKKDCFLFS